MSDEEEWPERDDAWLFAYLWHVSQPAVPEEAIRARVEELRVAVLEAGEPAYVVFGEPWVVAASDVEDLSTVDEELRAAGAAGWRGMLTGLASSLILVALLPPISLLIDEGWRADLRPGLVAMAIGFLTFATGVTFTRLFYEAARPLAMLVSLLLGLACFVSAVVIVATHSGAEPLVRDVPVLLFAAAMLLPGIVALLVARRIPESPPQTQWDDAVWLRRFRGALVLKGVSRSRIREQELEVRQMMSEAGATSLYDECGHPIGFARQLATHDRSAKGRRWGWGSVAQVIMPMLIAIAALPDDGQIWTWWRIVIFGSAVLLFAATVISQWRSRPWKAAA